MIFPRQASADLHWGPRFSFFNFLFRYHHRVIMGIHNAPPPPVRKKCGILERRAAWCFQRSESNGQGRSLILTESRCSGFRYGLKGAFFRYSGFFFCPHISEIKKKNMGMAYCKAWRMCIRVFPAKETKCGWPRRRHLSLALLMCLSVRSSRYFWLIRR